MGVFFIQRNVTTRENLWWSFIKSESYEAVNLNYGKLSELLGKDRLPKGAVSDWKGSIVASTRANFGDIPHQRCLAHLVRSAKNLLPLKSPFEATRKLRKIAEDLFLIETVHDPSVWRKELETWHKQYGFMLTEKTIAPEGLTKKWWYTHGNLRRAWKLLTRDQQPLLVFLINNLIPKTNNALEGVNSNLDQKLENHKGMKIPRQIGFLNWYMAFTRVKTSADLTKLWVWWKNNNLKI